MEAVSGKPRFAQRLHGNMVALVCQGVMIAIYALSVIAEHLQLFPPGSKYGLAFLYFLWPLAIAVVSVVVGAYSPHGVWFPLINAFSGLLYAASSFMYGPWYWDSFYLFFLVSYAVVGFIGFGIGKAIKHHKLKRAAPHTT